MQLHLLPFFCAPEKKKDFPFFACGATPSRTVNKTQPLEVAFSLQERVDSRSQKELPGEGWGGQGKKGKKDAQKKRWLVIWDTAVAPRTAR